MALEGGEETQEKLQRKSPGRMSASMDDKEQAEDPRVKTIVSTFRVIPHLQKQGRLFLDITPLLLDAKAFKNVVDLFVERYAGKGISIVAGIEARGFLFGPPVALAIGAKFIPLSKPQRLAGEVMKQEYELEYGSDCLEMSAEAVRPGERAVVVDDLIATGGTIGAAISLLERAGTEVVECACVVGVPKLRGRERLNGKPLFVIAEI